MKKCDFPVCHFFRGGENLFKNMKSRQIYWGQKKTSERASEMSSALFTMKNMVMLEETDYNNQFSQDPCEWHVYLH